MSGIAKEKCEKSVETNVELLPNEVLVMIFKKLEFQDQQQARIVCKKWESLITSEIPMSVNVNDSLKGNVKFIEKVTKTRIYATRIRQIAAIHALLMPKRVNLLTKLELDGFVHRNFISCVVPRLTNLKAFTVRGRTFLRSINFDQKVILGNLRSLKIYSPYNPRRGIPNGKFLNRNAELLFGENLRGLLSNVSCPSLETIAIDGDLDQLRLPPRVDWKNEVLTEFLESHRETLKNVLIGESSILKLRPFEGERDEAVPQYKNLHISLLGKGLTRYHPSGRPNRVDWCHLIRNQNELEYFNLGLLWYPFLERVVNTLPSTLKSVAIFWNTTTLMRLDAELFSELVNLEQLELTYDGQLLEVMINCHGLENCKKLKALVLEQITTPTEFIEGIPDLFPCLEMLYLFRTKNVEDEGIVDFLPPDEEFGITPSGLSGLMNTRSLKYLFVSADDFLAPEEMKEQMISSLVNCARYDSVTNGYHIGEEPSYPDIFSDDK